MLQTGGSMRRPPVPPNVGITFGGARGRGRGRHLPLLPNRFKKFKPEKGMDYFSSDWHLGHANIIKYDKRPFKDVAEMDETILDNVCDQLSKGDTLYYLGDFCFTRNSHAAEEYMKRLAWTEANLIFIRGNHDGRDMRRLYQKYGTYLGEQAKVTVRGQDIVLNHYCMKVWDKSHHGTWHLYGHSHHTLPEDPHAMSFDVGINGWDYKLISFDQVAEKMAKKDFKPIDHHGKTERV